MSILSDFSESNFLSASSIIGTKQFRIGSGSPIDVVKAEARYDRESEMNGFQRIESQTITFLTKEFKKFYPSDIKSQLGKHCTLDSEEWKIGDIEEGESFTTLMLISRTEVS